MYKIINGTNLIQRIKDNAFIPIDLGNKDYQEYLKYIKDGGTTLPAEPIYIKYTDVISNPIFSSILEALADITNIDVELLKNKTRDILNSKR